MGQNTRTNTKQLAKALTSIIIAFTADMIFLHAVTDGWSSSSVIGFWLLAHRDFVAALSGAVAFTGVVGFYLFFPYDP